MKEYLLDLRDNLIAEYNWRVDQNGGYEGTTFIYEIICQIKLLDKILDEQYNIKAKDYRRF